MVSSIVDLLTFRKSIFLVYSQCLQSLNNPPPPRGWFIKKLFCDPTNSKIPECIEIPGRGCTSRFGMPSGNGYPDITDIFFTKMRVCILHFEKTPVKRKSISVGGKCRNLGAEACVCCRDGGHRSKVGPLPLEE